MIYTANINMKLPGKAKRFDITVKSGHKVFAPGWDMVRGYKDGTIDEDEYIQQYLGRMRRSYRQHTEIWKKLIRLGQKANLILACYCPPKTSFCHRYVLAEIMEQLGCPIGGEVAEEDVVKIPRWANCYLRSRTKETG